MCITVQQLSYMHPDREVLFENVDLSLKPGEKVAIIGDNGSGKSILLKIITGELRSAGKVYCSSAPYYVPQHFGQYDELTVSEVLHADHKLKALQALLNGEGSQEDFEILGDDWDLTERIGKALSDWQISHIPLSRKLTELSGGEKTLLFLAGISLRKPEILLLDESTNHLDSQNRKNLYEFIFSFPGTVIFVSHDRTLLNMVSTVYELNKQGLTCYGGNYEFYKSRKEEMNNALQTKLHDKEKELKLARKTAREAMERRQKRDVREQKNVPQKGLSRMAVNTLKSNAEKSISKLKEVHAGKLSEIIVSLKEIQSAVTDQQLMKLNFNPSAQHEGKILVTARNINARYTAERLWENNLSFEIKSGERIEIKGRNGTGKSTLLKLITGAIKPSDGTLTLSDFRYVYLDQEYTIIQNNLTVFEQISRYNAFMPDHEIKTILNRFLFCHGTWDKLCGNLSGGEKMKLALCCLMVGTNTPDLFILDEPTNNIDIPNIEILTGMVKNYRGTVLIVSHDEYFVDRIGTTRSITLPG